MRSFLLAAVFGGMAICAASTANAASADAAGMFGKQIRPDVAGASTIEDVRSRRVCKWRWGKRRCWWVRDHRRGHRGHHRGHRGHHGHHHHR